MRRPSLKEYARLCNDPKFRLSMREYSPILDPMDDWLKDKSKAHKLKTSYSNFLAFLQDTKFQRETHVSEFILPISRRTFLGMLGGLFASATGVTILYHLSKPDILRGFISGKKTKITQPKIEQLLYEILWDKKITAGRALHLGGGIFLTCYHVVDPEHQWICHQSRRFSRASYLQFKLVAADKKKDLALLYVENSDFQERTLIQLSMKEPREKEMLSDFIRLNGSMNKDTVVQELYGVDYEDLKTPLYLGKFILRSSSLLFENQGFALSKNSFIKNILDEASKFDRDKDIYFFSSLMSFNGESGGPIFRCTPETYELIGVESLSGGIRHLIPTPNHPLKYAKVQQTMSFSLKPKVIRKFIEEYLKKTA